MNIFVYIDIYVNNLFFPLSYPISYNITKLNLGDIEESKHLSKLDFLSSLSADGSCIMSDGTVIT